MIVVRTKSTMKKLHTLLQS